MCVLIFVLIFVTFRSFKTRTDISAKTAHDFPPAYSVGRLNSDLNPVSIIKYIVLAFAMGCIVFFVPLMGWHSEYDVPSSSWSADGTSEGIMALGTTT